MNRTNGLYLILRPGAAFAPYHFWGQGGDGFGIWSRLYPGRMPRRQIRGTIAEKYPRYKTVGSEK